MNAQIELRRAQERLIQNPDVILSATDCRLLAFLKGIIDEVKIVGLSKEQMEKLAA